MNKKGVQLKLAFYAVIVIGMIVVLIGNWITAWDDRYDSNVDYNLDEYNRLEDIGEDISVQQSGIGVRSTDTGTDAESNTFSRVFGIITNIFEPFSIVFGNNGMIDSITEKFSLPDVVRYTIITLMLASLIWAIIAIIFRREKA